MSTPKSIGKGVRLDSPDIRETLNWCVTVLLGLCTDSNLSIDRNGEKWKIRVNGTTDEGDVESGSSEGESVYIFTEARVDSTSSTQYKFLQLRRRKVKVVFADDDPTTPDWVNVVRSTPYYEPPTSI